MRYYKVRFRSSKSEHPYREVRVTRLTDDKIGNYEDENENLVTANSGYILDNEAANLFAVAYELIKDIEGRIIDFLNVEPWSANFDMKCYCGTDLELFFVVTVE